MSALTITLISVAGVCSVCAISFGAVAIQALATIARRRSPERFPSDKPQFSIFEPQDFRTYIAAFRLLLSTPPTVVADPSCRRWLICFWLSSICAIGIIGWILARSLLS